MFGSSNKNPTPTISIKQAIEIISSTGKNVYSEVHSSVNSSASFVRDENFLDWENSHYWVAMAGCITAYSYFVFNEHWKSAQAGAKTISSAQQQFVTALKDTVFGLCRVSEPPLPGVQISKCLPLDSERIEFCRSYQVNDDVHVRMEMILGIILDSRVRVYYSDWYEGYLNPGFNGLATNTATRLGSHLVGIQTPVSLVSRSPLELGIKVHPIQSLQAMIQAFPLGS